MKSPPPKKKAKATASKVWKIDDKLSLDDATKLIAARTIAKTDNERTAEDRERKRITRAAKAGRLRRETDETFILGYLADWARAIWPGVFNDLPAYVCLSANCSIKCEGIASATVLAPTLEVCQERLNAAQRRIEELEKQLQYYKPIAERKLAENLKKEGKEGVDKSKTQNEDIFGFD